MTLDEWIDLYNRKNPHDKFQRDNRYALFFKEDKGFCEVLMTKRMAFIGQLGGDARYWKNAVDKAAEKAGIHHGGTINIRCNPPAYFRLFGYKVVKTELLKDGATRYQAINKTTKKMGYASPAFKYKDDGRQAFYITWDI